MNDKILEVVASLMRSNLIQIDMQIKMLESQRKVTLSVLEEVGAIPKTKKSTRGRKFMPEHERSEVSARMKRYWAARRKQRAIGAAKTGGDVSAGTNL